MDYAKVAQTALENSYLFLDMVERARDGSHGVGAQTEVAPAKAHVEQLLWRMWAKESVPHEEVHRALQIVAYDVGRECLAAEDKGFMRDIAGVVVSESAAAVERYQMVGEGMPGVAPAQIPSLRDRVFDQMTQMVQEHCMDDPDAEALLRGMSSVRRLEGLRELGERGAGTAMREQSQIRFPAINTDLLNRSFMNSWVHGVAAQKGLPGAQVLEPVIREAKLTGAIHPATFDSVVAAWQTNRPEVADDWIRNSVTALSKAAVSEQIMGEQSAEQLTALLRDAAQRQPSVTDGYRELADTYLLADKLDAAIGDVKATADRLEGIMATLAQIQETVAQPFQLQDLVGDREDAMSDGDRARVQQLFDAQDKVCTQMASLPEQLEALADSIRDAQGDEPSYGPSV
ncbi:MAG: hypothetical protein AWU57_612 [Marinobacter sp. T13-3]|mgnify:CR=1 FL=1|nr:MAG: hypothetical protein AWU57_612 [Marinobacter sp. T13-3]